MSMELFYGVHLPQVHQRMDALEQSLIRFRWQRERHQRLAALWLTVAPWCDCPYA